jgi:hypothetical protein
LLAKQQNIYAITGYVKPHSSGARKISLRASP